MKTTTCRPLHRSLYASHPVLTLVLTPVLTPVLTNLVYMFHFSAACNLLQSIRTQVSVVCCLAVV